MSEPAVPDPLDDLRRANPVAADALTSASLARVEARVQEEVVHGAKAGPRWGWPRFGLVGAGFALGVLAVIALATSGIPGGGPGPGGSGGLGIGFCVEQYGETALARRSVAFDGTVVAVAGDDVTFDVNRGYRGASTTSITLAAPGMTGPAVTPGGGPSFEVGRRYLVAGEDHFAWACGFSQAYAPDVAADWARVFGT
ncbi:MAG: hypothetical protein ABI620_08570 [Chloroflexota bacterium]